MREVESLENQTEIARVDLETRGISCRKPERAALEAFVEQAIPATREEQDLEPIAAAISEREKMTGEWVLVKNLSGQPRQAVESAAEIDRRRRHEDPDARGNREHHRTGRRDRTATASSTRVSPMMRRNIPPDSSISIVAATALGRIETSAKRGLGPDTRRSSANRLFQRYKRSTPRPCLSANRLIDRPLRSIRSSIAPACAAVQYERFDFDVVIRHLPRGGDDRRGIIRAEGWGLPDAYLKEDAMRPTAIIAFAFACSGVLASEPGQPLDCSDWVFLEPGYSCTRLFGGVERLGNLSPIQSDNTGRLFRSGPRAFIGACAQGAPIYRHPMEWRNGDVWTQFAYVDDRCVTPTTDDMDRFWPWPNPGTGPDMPFAPGLAFDPTSGRMLLSVLSEGSPCSNYPSGCGDYWVASISGFATTFDVLQTYTPQPAALAFRVPYMPEGMGGADHFDTYWGDLTHPFDFTHAHPLACNYPAAAPHVGDYLNVADTVPTPSPGQGVYYVTSTTYQGTTRYGRKTTTGHLSGRDPALLPACSPSTSR